ncbi:Hypothetical protein SRAE_2000517700 [Strongyloides ratti]|uniref:Uncharacterized protein n=1 Tax=Strongyloides ratti TaxID=34506 RepID=A0A090LSG2_STRRB|nr:Hypothetical protein SRAE_2000517700 [Strongyloides ratti]CEF70548.1 Hypothetical protein SRAE_2000517700 [Strongyloides ratti]
MSKKKFFSKIAKFLKKENDSKKLEKLRVARHKRQRAPSALSDQLYNYEPMPTIYEVDEYDTISVDSATFNESFDSGRRDSAFSVSYGSDSGHSSISTASSKSSNLDTNSDSNYKLKNFKNNNISITKTCSSIIQSTSFPNVIQQPIIF